MDERPADPEHRPGWLRRLFGAVRVRAAFAATAVVAVALFVAGFAVLRVVGDNLEDAAELKADSKVRQVSARVAVSSSPRSVELPDSEEYPAQVVTGHGAVLDAGEGLRDRRTPIARFHSPGSSDSPDDRDDNGDEDRDEDDGDDVAGGVDDEVAHRTVRLPVDDDGEVETDRDDVTGTAEFRVAAQRVTLHDGTPATVYVGSSLAERQRAVSDARDAMWVGFPGLLLVVAAVTWAVTRRALRPVAAIRAELAEITYHQDLGRRVPQPASGDEVAQLAYTTNVTLAALQLSVERQRAFVADASHELRSPIASLRTQVEVAQAHPELWEPDELLADVVRLQGLAGDLLLLARLDAGEHAVREPVDLVGLVREEVSHRSGDRVPVTFTEPVGRPGPEGGAQVGEGPAWPAGNRAQLARVVTNLLDNAVRHARGGVWVSVHQPRADQVCLRVQDDGAGVPPDQREAVFRRFVRLDDARSRDEGGAGLGLAIVGDVVRGHGGSIEVAEAPGGGARFTVSLPVSGHQA